MLSYYSSIFLLVCLSLGILSILVHAENRISRDDKRMFYMTYMIIGLSALAEWGGVQLNGNENTPKWLLRAVKCCDYILTPMAAYSLVEQIKIQNHWNKILKGILVGNAVFQILSCFNTWMIIIDDHNRYSHGSLYIFYLLLNFSVIALTFIQFLIYGKNFRRENRISLYSIHVMIGVGIMMQEIFGGEIRTEYIALTLGVTFLFIYFTGFSQQTDEEQIMEQQIQISTDALTGLLSRHAYSKTLEDYTENLPQDLAAFSVDVNGLKTVNDSMGHEAGDEMIRGAAECIKNVFGKTGKCYRTGGDEFVVFIHMDKEQADSAVEQLKRETEQWHGKTVRTLHMSAGYALAADHEGFSCEMLVKEADMAMYAAKRAYYMAAGRDRRH